MVQWMICHTNQTSGYPGAPGAPGALCHFLDDLETLEKRVVGVPLSTTDGTNYILLWIYINVCLVQVAKDILVYQVLQVWTCLVDLVNKVLKALRNRRLNEEWVLLQQIHKCDTEWSENTSDIHTGRSEWGHVKMIHGRGTVKTKPHIKLNNQEKHNNMQICFFAQRLHFFPCGLGLLILLMKFNVQNRMCSPAQML